MATIIEGYAIFLPYCFMFLVVAMVWNAVMRVFSGGRL